MAQCVVLNGKLTTGDVAQMRGLGQLRNADAKGCLKVGGRKQKLAKHQDVQIASPSAG